MDSNFSWDKILEMLKEALKGMAPGWIGDKAQGLMDMLLGPILGPIKALFSFIPKSVLKDNPLEKLTENLTSGVQNIATNLVNTLDKDLGAVQKAAPTAVTAFLEKSKTALSLEESVWEDVKQATLKTVNKFYSNAIPKLDEQGRPIAAIAASKELYAHILETLKGNGTTTAGALPNIKNREAEAKRIATLITGVTDETSLVAAAPTTGLVGMLAKTQQTRYAKDFKAESMVNQTLVMTSDPQLLTSVANNPKIAGGKDITPDQDMPAPNGKNPNAPQRTHA